MTYCWWLCCFFQKAIRSVILHVIKFIVWPEKHLPWMITSLNGCQECPSSLLAWSMETRYLFCKSYLRTKTFYACCLSTYYVNFTGNFVSSLPSYILLCFSKLHIQNYRHSQFPSRSPHEAKCRVSSSHAQAHFDTKLLNCIKNSSHSRHGTQVEAGIVNINDQPTCQDQKHQPLIGIN